VAADGAHPFGEADEASPSLTTSTLLCRKSCSNRLTKTSYGYGKAVEVLAGMIGAEWKHFVQPNTVHLHQVPDSKKRAAKSAFIRDEEDAKTNYGAGDAIDPEETLTANSFLPTGRQLLTIRLRPRRPLHCCSLPTVHHPRLRCEEEP
jgi:hypothetical protein